MKEFDENELIKYIRAALLQTTDAKYSDDDLLNIVDMIWDYYELNGLLDVDVDDSDDDEITDIVAELKDYTARMLRKDKACKVNEADLETIIMAELAYEDILDSEMD